MIDGYGDESVRGKLLCKICMKLSEALPSMGDDDHRIHRFIAADRSIDVGVRVDLCSMIKNKGRQMKASCKLPCEGFSIRNPLCFFVAFGAFCRVPDLILDSSVIILIVCIEFFSLCIFQLVDPCTHAKLPCGHRDFLFRKNQNECDKKDKKKNEESENPSAACTARLND